MRRPPRWDIAFGSNNPLEVDLGCGRGHYAWARAQAHPGVNVMALDWKRKWIEHLRSRRSQAQLRNFTALRCDISQDLPRLFSQGSVTGFTLFHPDPWWKKRHRKRRLVQEDFVKLLASRLCPGGWFYAQTDVADLLEEIRIVFEASGLFAAMDAKQHHQEHLLGLQSHRAGKCMTLGVPIFRAAYRLAQPGVTL